jgi:glycosyltransferase involved in cell wall biosynthesis
VGRVKVSPIIHRRMATFDEVPEYLKSLEQMLSRADETVQPSASAAANDIIPLQEQSQSQSQSQSLSSIGFGSMFATAQASAQVPASAPTQKTKFMLVSTHVHQFTGYSKVSYGILSELARHPWIQLTHYAFQKQSEVPAGFRPYPPNVEVIDAVALEKPLQQGFGIQALPDVIRRKRPNVVMIYNDLSVVTRFLEEIRKSGIPRNFQIWVYCDQVYTMQPQLLLDVLNRDADRIFAFTPYWKQVLKEQGVTRPIDVLLHGFQSNTYFPMPRELARKQLQLPNDVFLFLNLNRNQPRKRYDILIMAFVELLVKYPTKPLYLLAVCDKGEKGGWWLFELFQRELRLKEVSLELYGNRLIVTTQNLAFKDEEINLFYNAADVGISTADGEGFGLCQFEHMGVGVPQVVPDIGGFKEFCDKNNSSLVKPTVRYYIPNGFSPVSGEAHACQPHDVCLAMEEYVLNSEKRAEHGKLARAKVLPYNWKNSCEILLKRLQEAMSADDL